MIYGRKRYGVDASGAFAVPASGQTYAVSLAEAGAAAASDGQAAALATAAALAEAGAASDRQDAALAIASMLAEAGAAADASAAAARLAVALAEAGHAADSAGASHLAATLAELAVAADQVVAALTLASALAESAAAAEMLYLVSGIRPGPPLRPASLTRLLRPRALTRCILPTGVSMQALAFSDKHPADTRPLAVDFSDLMDDPAAPPLVGGSVAFAPDDGGTMGGLALAAAPTWAGQVLGFTVAGGVDGTRYVVTVTGRTASGWVETVLATLYVTAAAPPSP